MEVKDAVWRTRDGRLLAMHEIGDDHLVNIIRLLQRRALDRLAAGYAALGWLNGEAATYEAERSIDEEQAGYEAALSLFTDEARCRGLRW